MTTYENTPEDAMVNRLIRYHRQSVDPDPEPEDLYPTEIEFLEPEAHYNYYGNRGVADLYACERERLPDRTDYYSGKLYEVKSANAVRAAGGANDIVRQFKKMKKYFFQDETWELPQMKHYELCFIPCPTTVQHVAENRDIYNQLPDYDSENNTRVLVVFRAPEGDITPGNAFFEDTVEASILATRPEFAPHIGVEKDTCEAIIRSLDRSEEGIEWLLGRMENGYNDA